MKLNKWMLFAAIISLLMLGACGSKEKNKEEAAPAAADTVDKKDTKEKEEAPKEDPAEEEKEETGTETDGEILNPYIAERTGGDIEVVFTNKEPGLTHNFNDEITYSIDEYQIVRVSNMNESAKVDFDGEEEGYVLTYKETLKNGSDGDIFFNRGAMMESDDATEYIIRKSHFVDREQWMKDDSTDKVSVYTKGKTATGLDAFVMTKAQYEKLKAPIMTSSKPYLNEDGSGSIGKEATFAIPFNDEGAETASANAKLYQDRMVTDTIATKELFFDKEDINETKQIDKVKVTLNGVQYANVTPTEGNKERFRNFGDGALVSLTAKLTIENGSDTPFAKSFIDKRLIIDGDRGTMLSQGMLEPFARGNLEPGQTEEVLAVFLFREDEFQIFKKFELQIGPLAGEDAKKLFKEKSVTFNLPMKQ